MVGRIESRLFGLQIVPSRPQATVHSPAPASTQGSPGSASAMILAAMRTSTPAIVASVAERLDRHG